jgi:peptide subunit release factor 1 (eRF1)
MLKAATIDELSGFDSGGEPVLSVYLGLGPDRQARRSYRIVFEDLVRDQRERLERPLREAFVEETVRVQAWLEGQEPRGKALTLFSCGPRGLWQAHFLSVGIRDHLAFDQRADLAPLLDVLDEYERYAVALVDKERARILTVFAGEIEETEVFKDFVPGKHDQGALSQARYQRHHEAHVYRHLKRVVARLAELLRRRRFDRLIVAGPDEATSELRRLLPRVLSRRLAAMIPAWVSATDAEILEQTLEVERRIERETEARLLDDLLEKAGAGGRATCGVLPTLDALWFDAVQTLVVADGVHVGGVECPRCGRLDPGSFVTCPVCDAPTRPVHDLFHRAMGVTRELAGSVEVLHSAAAVRLLASGGGLGALLRYRPPQPAAAERPRPPGA